MNYRNPNLPTRKAKTEKMPVWEVGLIAFFLYYYLLPSAANSLSFIIMLGLGFVYMLYVLMRPTMREHIMFTIFRIFACIVFVTCCYFVLTQTKTIDTSVGDYELKRFLSKFQQLFFTFLPLLFLYRVIKFSSQQQQNFLLIFSVAIIGYVMIQTFEELAANDTATRVWTDFSAMENKNIGTYNFVYAVSVCVPTLFALLLNVKKGVHKFVLAIGFIVGFVFLIVAKYTLSLLITVLLCYVAILVSAKKRLTKVITLIITPAFLLFLPYIIEIFALRVATGSMQIRLLEVAGYFSGESMGYNLNGRLTLYKDTLDVFLSSPLIGDSSMKFDGHATFLTVLSDNGLLGAIPFYWLYFSSKKRVNAILQDPVMEKCFFLAFLSVILTGFVNPIHAALPLPMAAWFVVPLLVAVCLRKKEG